MRQDIVDIFMNPVRLRIVQFLVLHTTGTARQMREELSDIPLASLYRHINILLKANCLEIAAENQVRGTVEKTYRLVSQPFGDPGPEDVAAVFQGSLVSLLATFQRYFAHPDSDPVRDMLSISTSTLMLTDEEFLKFLKNLSAVVEAELNNSSGEGRKPRRLTFLSSPCEEQIPPAKKAEKEE